MNFTVRPEYHVEDDEGTYIGYFNTLNNALMFFHVIDGSNYFIRKLKEDEVFPEIVDTDFELVATFVIGKNFVNMFEGILDAQ